MDRLADSPFIDVPRRLRQVTTSLVLALCLSTLLLSLTPLPAAARVNNQRDRRPDREVSVPYQRAPVQPSRRQLSGFATRQQRTSDAHPAAKSADREQASGNKNDEKTAVRDTNRRSTR